jgi:hypothetical protein
MHACAQTDVQSLEAALERAQGDVDILLTCQWPAHVTAAAPPDTAPACTAGKNKTLGSSLPGDHQLPRPLLSRASSSWMRSVTSPAACRAGSEVVAELATKVRPRYHVAAGEAAFYARPPYLNSDLGAGACSALFRTSQSRTAPSGCC